MSQSLFTIVSILIIYHFIQDDEVPIYAYLVSLLVVSLLSFFSFRYHLNKKSFGKEKAELEILNYSQILKISIPLMFFQSVQFIMAWTDKLMLGSMTTTVDVGIYHTAFKLSMFLPVALMSVNSIAFSKICEMFAKKDMLGLKKVVHQSTKMIFGLLSH